jgi:predicted acyltransferase
MILLGIFYLVIDVWGWKKWAFCFMVIGSNAIVAYMIVRIVNFGDIANKIASGLDPWTGSWTGFVHATAAFGILRLGLWYMYRNKTFIKF